MLQDIDAIVFDFGGVILELHEDTTIQKMADILHCSKEECMQHLIHQSKFYEFECGKISADEFISEIQKSAPKTVSKKEIITAWNAMLGRFPEEHCNLLLALQKNYRTFLLSNTNVIHIEAFEKNMKLQNIPYRMTDLFEEVWYSSSIGMRKPHPETYVYCMQKVGLIPQRTLFIDDKEENIQGAQKAGMKTLHIANGVSIISFFTSNTP